MSEDSLRVSHAAPILHVENLYVRHGSICSHLRHAFILQRASHVLLHMAPTIAYACMYAWLVQSATKEHYILLHFASLHCSSGVHAAYSHFHYLHDIYA